MPIGDAMPTIPTRMEDQPGEARRAPPIEDMSAEELRHISRKLTTYADIYTGDKEARRMARRCWDVAALLDAAIEASEPPDDEPDIVRMLDDRGPLSDHSALMDKAAQEIRTLRNFMKGIRQTADLALATESANG